jgi:hypothetical protein
VHKHAKHILLKLIFKGFLKYYKYHVGCTDGDPITDKLR